MGPHAVAPLPDLPAPLSDGVVSLRRFSLHDVGDVTRACQDPDIHRWTASIPSPYEAAHARGWIEQHRELWERGATAPLAIVDTATGGFLGAISLQLDHGGPTEAAVGYWVAAWARRRGVATRALRLATTWGFEVLGLDELHLATKVGNVASERVAEHGGFECTGTDAAHHRPADPSDTFVVKEWRLERPAAR